MTTTLEDTIRYRPATLRLSAPWNKFLGKLPAEVQWTGLLYGGPGGGKSSLALLLTEMFSNYGPAVYFNHEEDLAGGTIQDKARRLKLRSKKFTVNFYRPKNIDDMRAVLDQGKYKYAIIDSLTSMADSRSELLEIFKLPQFYEDISFLFILHADKSEKVYIGPSKLKHNVGLSIFVDKDHIATVDKNRFNKSNISFDVFKRKLHHEKNVQKTKQKGKARRFRFNE